jgi:hypothetical protein
MSSWFMTWHSIRHHNSRRPALLRLCERYLLNKRPTFLEIPAQQLLQEMEVPNFLHDLAKHLDFANLPHFMHPLTLFNFWDSVQIRIPTSLFAPEPRVTRLYAISSLTDRRAKHAKPRPKSRADSIFYLPEDKEFDHEMAKIHGM